MKIKTGNLFDISHRVICITTNGIVTKNGLVMGAGVALYAKNLYPNLPKSWGAGIQRYGNIPLIYPAKDGRSIVSFPTKNSFKDKSDISLIINSAKMVVEAADLYNWSEIYLPPPGCGLGGLQWPLVQDVLSPILDDRFIIVFKED